MRERKEKVGGSGLMESNMVGGVPGFLRTRPYPDRTPGSGGNLALKDIAMGLRWVRENIAAFGGDPTKITLIGHDTGAALVNLLLLAPYGKGESYGFLSLGDVMTAKDEYISVRMEKDSIRSDLKQRLKNHHIE